jgi:hypothetical protein
MTSPRKQRIKELLSKFSKRKLFLASELQAVKTLPVVKDTDMFCCPACQGTGNDNVPKYAMGNIFYVRCSYCKGQGEMCHEDLTALIHVMPEVLWEACTLNWLNSGLERVGA